MAMTPASLPSTRDEDRGRAVARAAARPRASSAPVAMPSSARNAALPSTTRVPLDHADRALAGGRVEAARPARARCLRSAAAATIAARQRMLARALDAGGKAQHLVLVEAVRRRRSATTFGLAFGQRAGLVDHQRVDLLHALQRLGVLDQHAGLRAAADADHDRHRRREPERAGAGDDQHASPRRPGRRRSAAPARTSPRRRRRATATAITAGTNQPDTWSASRWIGARERCASATICTICASMRVAADLLGAHDEARRSG